MPSSAKGETTEQFLSRFLGIDPREARYLEMKLALSASVRQMREREGLTQADLAKLMKSGQSRVAKVEGADASVSIDLMVKALLALGATRQEVAEAISKPLGRLELPRRAERQAPR